MEIFKFGLKSTGEEIEVVGEAVEVVCVGEKIKVSMALIVLIVVVPFDTFFRVPWRSISSRQLKWRSGRGGGRGREQERGREVEKERERERKRQKERQNQKER